MGGGAAAEGVFIRALVGVPAGALGEVVGVELPLFFGVVQAVLELFFLVSLGDVEEELEDRDALIVERALEIVDVVVSLSQ